MTIRSRRKSARLGDPAIHDNGNSGATTEMGVVVLGGRRPAIKHALAVLQELVATVHMTKTVDDLVFHLFSELPDVVIIDSAGPVDFRAEIIARALPSLQSDQIPVIWIGGSRPVAVFDTQLTEVVLDTPFSKSDMEDALATAIWAGGGGRPRTGTGARATAPLSSKFSQLSKGVDKLPRRIPSDQRTTDPYKRKEKQLDGRPRLGTGENSDAFRALRELENIKRLKGVEPPRAPKGAATNVTSPSAKPLRPNDSPQTHSDGAPRKGVLIDNRYRIMGQLGRGGSAWVLEARDEELDEVVALKLMRTDIDDAIVRRRFRREMRVCRRLVHPHIVRTFEFGNWRNRMYYTMELLRGLHFADLMFHRPTKVSLSGAILLLEQACDGLQSAHDLGIVHRDVKPQNLFVLESGDMMKVTDFGVAKGTGDVGLTITHGNLVVGTPAYLPPERLEDSVDVSPATDIYSLGATMYHVFTGRLPHKASDLATLLTAIVTRQPRPVRSLNPMIPQQLEAIIERAMHRDPSKRHGSCTDLRDDLRALRHELT